MDIDQAAQVIRDAEIEDFIEGFNQPTSAVCGSMGSGLLPGHPSTGGPGTVGPRRSGSSNATEEPRHDRCYSSSGGIRSRSLIPQRIASLSPLSAAKPEDCGDPRHGGVFYRQLQKVGQRDLPFRAKMPEGKIAPAFNLQEPH
jgi:hypothetical protein